MHCPACASSLSRVVESGIEVDECASCGGIWFDEGELGALIRQGLPVASHIDAKVQPLAPSAERVSDRNCPKCHLHLDTFHYDYASPIELDICRSCGGLWVDDTELEAIARYVAMQSIGNGDAAEAIAFLSGSEARAHSRQSAVQHISQMLMSPWRWLVPPGADPHHKSDLP